MQGKTALVKAATGGYANSTHKLLNAGAHMYVTDKRGQTVFGTSARNGHNSYLNILMKEAEKKKRHTAYFWSNTEVSS